MQHYMEPSKDTLDYRIKREYLTLLIRQLAGELDSAIKKNYERMCEKEKIHYSQSKQYHIQVNRKEQKKGKNYGLDTQKGKMGYWVSAREKNSSSDPHITYSSNVDRQGFDLSGPLPGFNPSKSFQTYKDDILSQLAEDAEGSYFAKMIITLTAISSDYQTVAKEVDKNFSSVYQEYLCSAVGLKK